MVPFCMSEKEEFGTLRYSCSRACMEQRSTGASHLIVQIPLQHKNKTRPVGWGNWRNNAGEICCISALRKSRSWHWLDSAKWMSTGHSHLIIQILLSGGAGGIWDTKVSMRSSPHWATLHRSVAFDCSNPSTVIKQNPIQQDGVLFYGGAGGIWTLGTLLGYTRFPVVPVMTTSILLHGCGALADLHIILYVTEFVKP